MGEIGPSPNLPAARVSVRGLVWQRVYSVVSGRTRVKSVSIEERVSFMTSDGDSRGAFGPQSPGAPGARLAARV